MAGRDRMCAVLERYLEPEMARERANNIAQVLALVSADPVLTALGMLSRLELPDVSGVAIAVGLAWSQDADVVREKVA